MSLVKTIAEKVFLSTIPQRLPPVSEKLWIKSHARKKILIEKWEKITENLQNWKLKSRQFGNSEIHVYMVLKKSL